MNLVIDIGNTAIKAAQFNNETCVQTKRFLNENEFLNFCAENTNKTTIISSVRELSFTNKTKTLLKKAILLNHTTDLPIKNNYASPITLGNDRIANAVGASSIYPYQNNLVIDVGTCLKLDFVNDENEFLGGSISPGLKMRFNALHTLTDNLPLVEDVEINQLIGNDTISSIQVGAYQGMIAELRNMVYQYEKKYSQLNILFTGGDLDYFTDVDLSQKNSIFADDLLTLKGLNTILNYNVQK